MLRGANDHDYDIAALLACPVGNYELDLGFKLAFSATVRYSSSIQPKFARRTESERKALGIASNRRR